MHGKLLGEELSVQQIAQVARFLRRKAEQTHHSAMTLHDASCRAAGETGRLAASARAAADRLTRLRRLDVEAQHGVHAFRGFSHRLLT